MVWRWGCHSGRTGPRSTFTVMPSFSDSNAAMREATSSKISCVGATVSTCARQRIGITLTNVPPSIVPTENVMPRSKSVMFSICSMRRAMARMALRPWRLVAPACAGRPSTSIQKRWKAKRPVTMTPFLQGSVTRTYLWRFASSSIRSRDDGLPISSSGTSMKVTGSGAPPACSRTIFSASTAIATPPFMS